MFKLCNIPLDQMVERMAKAKAINHERRQRKQQANDMPPHVADNYERWDSALLAGLKTLQLVEQHHPGLLEALPRPAHPTPTPPATAPAKDTPRG